MRRGTATTLQDVAREAGVSIMTVSVVLNGARSATRVSEATRARIVEAAARLRYRPNAVARGLSRRRMDALGVVAAVEGQDINLYFLEVLNGILAAAAARGQNITVFSITDWTADEAKIVGACDGRVDGLILIAPELTPEFAESLCPLTPFVTIHGGGAAHTPDLEVDDEAGARAAVRHLLERGHRRIAHFTGGLTAMGARLRLDGYRAALTEAGVGADDALVFPGHFSIESGRQQAAEMLAAPGPRPTAVFCASDAIAYGAMEVLAARGLRVPGDLSVVGFDDLILARMTTPHLTTVRQPFRRMGERAVERLLLAAADSGAPGEEAETTTEVFDVELVVRDSVGPPP